MPEKWELPMTARESFTFGQQTSQKYAFAVHDNIATTETTRGKMLDLALDDDDQTLG